MLSVREIEREILPALVYSDAGIGKKLCPLFAQQKSKSGYCLRQKGD